MKLFTFLMAVLFVSQVEAQDKKIIHLSAHYAGTCFGSKTTVKCVDSRNGYIENQTIDGYKNINAISVGGGHVCVNDDVQMWCWGTFFNSYPGIYSPSLILAGNSYTCAVQDNILECWGGTNLAPIQLTNPTKIVGSQEHICALDNGEIKCWPVNTLNTQDRGQFNIPPLLNIQYFSNSDFNTCAIDDLGAKCWKIGDTEAKLYTL